MYSRFIIKIDEIKSKFVDRNMIKKLLKMPIQFYGNKQLQIIFVTNIPITNYNQKEISKKFGLLFNLFYDVTFRTDFIGNSNVTEAHQFKEQGITEVMDLIDSKYFREELDDCQKYLNEGMLNIHENNIIDGFPKLVIWTDKYIGKGTSGFCKVRDGLIHPDEKFGTREKLEKQYPDQLEFASDDGLLRDSEKNIEFLYSKLPELINEIKAEFEKRYSLDVSLLEKKPLFPLDELNKS